MRNLVLIPFVLVILFMGYVLYLICGKFGLYLFAGTLAFLIAVITRDGALGLIAFVLVNIWLWGTSFALTNRSSRGGKPEEKECRRDRDDFSGGGDINP